MRVLRGGSWNNSGKHCRIANRTRDRARALADAQAAVADCGALLLARCELPLPLPTDALDRSRALVDACLHHYCPRLDGPEAPAMCQGDAAAFLASASGEEVQAQVRGLFVAMLALDFARPRTDATIERVSRRFARLWAAPVQAITVAPRPAEEHPQDPLALEVSLGADGIVLRGKGIEPITLPAGDMEALRTTAQRLANEHPGAKTVAIEAAPSIPMQQLVDALDALMGDCGEGRGEGGCRFPRVELVAPR